jgi:hypothetical protein
LSTSYSTVSERLALSWLKPVLRDRLSAVAHAFANALEWKRSDLAVQHAYPETTQLKERLELDNQCLRQEFVIEVSDDAIVAQ